MQSRDPAVIIAHRGSSGRAPENTMLAFTLAMEEDGADGLELDLRCSRDGELVVFHDATVERTTDGHGAIADMSLAELRALDAGFQFRSADGSHPFRGRGIRIPTLRELLQRFAGVWMSIELKDGDATVQRATVDMLRQYNCLDRVVTGSEQAAVHEGLKRLVDVASRFFDRRDAWRFFLRHQSRCWWRYQTPAGSLQIPTRVGPIGLDSKRLVDDAHRQGIAVRYWTINDPEEMRSLLELGADGLITDHPALLREVLVAMGRRS